LFGKKEYLKDVEPKEVARMAFVMDQVDLGLLVLQSHGLHRLGIEWIMKITGDIPRYFQLVFHFDFAILYFLTWNYSMATHIYCRAFALAHEMDDPTIWKLLGEASYHIFTQAPILSQVVQRYGRAGFQE
jgi:hypothetical protein